ASATAKVLLDGYEVLITVRDTDESRMLARLGTLLKSGTLAPLPARGQARPQPRQPQPPQLPQGSETPPCWEHGAMRQNRWGKWYCPVKLANGTWCPTKA